MSLLVTDLRASIRFVAIEYSDLRAYGYKVAEVLDDDANKFDKPDDEFVMQVLRTLEWLADVPKTARMNGLPSSHGYKHEVERWHRSSGLGGDCYISNGAFIVAAIIAGFEVKRCGPDSPNAYFNMGKRKVEQPAPAPVTELSRSFIRRLPRATVGG